jgi:hypothetical protein
MPDSNPGCEAAPPYPGEKTRARIRRLRLAIQRPNQHEDRQWGLALSGGGIRSATFSLGVLQALVKARSPGTAADRGAEAGNTALLRQFDYLSTVSGGGYIGSFFVSLFVPGRVDPERRAPGSQDPGPVDWPDDAADRAYRALAYEPPGRLRSEVHFEERSPGQAPLAWLRENGRYLTPTGAGDWVYAIAMTLRNWLSVHYIIGTWLLLAATVILGLRAFASLWQPYRDREYLLLGSALAHLGGYDGTVLWHSLLWWVPVLLVVAWVVPTGVSFWLTRPEPGQTVLSAPARFSQAIREVMLVALVLLTVVLAASPHSSDLLSLTRTTGLLTFVTLAAIGFYLRSARQPTIGDQRVYVTRALATSLKFTSAFVLLAILDSVAQSLYLRATYLEAVGVSVWTIPAGFVTAAVWVVRKIAAWSSEQKTTGIASAIPWNTLAGIAGVVLLFLVGLLWFLFADWIAWQGQAPDPSRLDDPVRLLVLLGALILVSGVARLGGRFPAFLNLSTFQSLYSARLTRAYLGATNGKRFIRNAARDTSLRSVAEPHKNDQITHAQYYGSVLAPIHLINVCVNQTSDPDEQLVQRDRKGKPLAVHPSGFMIDGKSYRFTEWAGDAELGKSLTIGEWVAVSGAAFTTGLGRTTSLGLSLLLGLANVRLGRWWPSGVGDEPPRLPKKKWLEAFALKTFPTQTHLAYEFFARFHGLRRTYQYISDGGHFENTGIYELLRRERDVSLIVCCDCGADPKYQFQDLANLIRLVRIDLGVEIVVDRAIASDPALSSVFGVPEYFTACAASGKSPTKCAILLQAFQPGLNPNVDRPSTHIILIKPTVIDGVAGDIEQYKATHPIFPEEPTSDQFFDEAQWESYRRLGLEVGRRIFGSVDSSTGSVAEALWARVGGQARQFVASTRPA